MNFSSLKGYLTLSLKGFCMGTADIITGISGGTIAFILGIYEEFVNAIRSFDLKFLGLLLRGRWRDAFFGTGWKFLSAVCLGIAAAILVLSGILSWLLRNKPVLIYAFFFGLILATVPIIARIIKKWSAAKLAVVLLSAIGTYFLVGMVPVSTPEASWFVFLSGAIAICAMILPGISGAFILVLLGKYHFILQAVNERDFFVLGVFLSGIVVGILGFVRILSWLFERYHDVTVALLTGLVIGSLRKVWPWKEVVSFIQTSTGKMIPVEEINVWPPQFGGEFIWAVLLILGGFFLALGLNGVNGTKELGFRQK